MGIFDRMSRVISSNFNSLLDKAEDPAETQRRLTTAYEDFGWRAAA